MTTARKVGFLCLAICLPGLCRPNAALELPNTPVAAVAGEWLRLCQAPNLERFTHWIIANVAVDTDARAAGIARENTDFCQDNGALEAIEVIESSPQKLTLQARGANSGIWYELRWSVNDAGKINGGRKFPVTPPETSLPRDLSDAGIARYVRDAVVRQSRAGLFSGIVMVARGSKVIVSSSGGFANRDRKTPVTGATQFTLGSMGKLFTAVAIGQLIDRGKLSLTDTVGRFFPDYPNATVREQVTVEMLLSHTAGLGDFLSRRTPAMMTSGVKRAAEFMPLYERDEPKFAPGSSWSYSNAGLALAGAIVEQVSGEEYPSYLRNHIFAVAGMTNSDPNNIPHGTSALVTPYTRISEQGEIGDWEEAEHDIGSPAGGSISTSSDLLRFADSLRNGRLISKATFETLVKPNAHSPPGYPYGDAFEIHSIYGRTTAGHSGGFPGVSTDLRLFLDSNYTVVVLANLDFAAESATEMAAAAVAERLKLSK